MFKRVKIQITSINKTLVVSGVCALLFLPRVSIAQEDLTVLAGIGVPFMHVYVADKGGLFAAEGLNVSVKMSTTGKVAVDGLVAGAGVMAVSGAFPAISAAATAPIQIVTPVASGDGSISLVVVPEINDAGDLKGKRFGFQIGTDAHLFFIRYIEQQGLMESDVEVRNLPAEGLVSAFARGDLDAVVTWEPITTEALGVVEGAKVIADRGVSPYFIPISMRKDFIESNPEGAQKLMRALVAAQDIITNDIDRAIAYTAEAANIEEDFIVNSLDAFNFTMVISEDLYQYVDAMANFMVLIGVNKEKGDARQIVNAEVMKAVAPENVK